MDLYFKLGLVTAVPAVPNVLGLGPKFGQVLVLQAFSDETAGTSLKWGDLEVWLQSCGPDAAGLKFYGILMNLMIIRLPRQQFMWPSWFKNFWRDIVRKSWKFPHQVSIPNGFLRKSVDWPETRDWLASRLTNRNLFAAKRVDFGHHTSPKSAG